jgi:excisionase family DNA binding protein
MRSVPSKMTEQERGVRDSGLSLQPAVEVSSLLRAEDVATALKVSPRLVYRWAHEGVLRTAPLPGRLVRFRPEDVQALIDGLDD